MTFTKKSPFIVGVTITMVFGLGSSPVHNRVEHKPALEKTGTKEKAKAGTKTKTNGAKNNGDQDAMQLPANLVVKDLSGEKENRGQLSEIFDPKTLKWSPASKTDVFRHVHSAALLKSGQVLVVEGGAQKNDAAHIYDPIRQIWSLTNDPVAVVDPPAILLADGRILYPNAKETDLPLSAKLTSTVFDPRTAKWKVIPKLDPTHRGFTASALLNGKAIITGGYNQKLDPTTMTAIFDPTSDVWVAGPPLQARRRGHLALLLTDGRLFVFGGKQTGVQEHVSVETTFPSVKSEFLEPGLKEWRNGPDLPFAFVNGSAVLLKNGMVLAACLGKKETLIYDPVANKWSIGAEMKMALISCTAVTLQDGRVLVAGGLQVEPWTYTKATEIYDPKTNLWSIAQEMTSLREVSLTVLPDGRVLNAGGSNPLPADTTTGKQLQNPVKIVEATSISDSSGDSYMIEANEYSEQQLQWLKSIIEFVYSATEIIPNVNYENHTEIQITPNEMTVLMKNRELRTFLGDEIVGLVDDLIAKRNKLYDSKMDILAKHKFITDIFQDPAMKAHENAREKLKRQLLKKFKLSVTSWEVEI